MALDAEFKKLINGGKWALNAPDNRTPEDTSVTPALNRTAGFPSSYSQVNGNVPDRRRINQIFRELSGAAFEVIMGVSLYDAEVNYPISAITQAADGRLYRAKVANGPSTGNATSPLTAGQSVWEAVSGAVSAPDAPYSIDFDNSVSNRLTVRWKDGRDNGARIESYKFQHRIGGSGNWVPATPEVLQYAEKVLTGIAPNTQIFVRARATNNIGDGPWKTDDTGEVITGTKPGGGDTIGLLATPGDAQAVLTWTAPSDGGFPILRYVVQWRDGTQSYSTGRQTTVSDSLTSTITSLTNDTLYYFRVAAVNQVDQGDWSNVAQATPVSATITIYHPTALAPSLTANSNGSISARTSLRNSTLGQTAEVTRTDWQIRKQGGSWTNFDNASDLVSQTFTGLDSGSTYDIRYRVYSSVESNPDWSPFASVAARGAVPDAPISVSGSAWWRRTVNGIHGNSGMTVSITPGSTNGSPITMYGVRATFNKSTIFNPGENIGGKFTYTVSVPPPQGGGALINRQFRLSSTPQKGSSFTIFGRVQNANGWGPWTESATLTVGGD